MTLDGLLVQLKSVLLMVMVGVALWTLLTNLWKSWHRAEQAPMETTVWCIVRTLPASVLNMVLAMVPLIVAGPQLATSTSVQLVIATTIGFCVTSVIYLVVASGKATIVRVRDELSATL